MYILQRVQKISNICYNECVEYEKGAEYVKNELEFRGGGDYLAAVRSFLPHCEKEKVCYTSDMKHHLKSIKKGFTLAEVLITLGIIGVVAALTLPSLIQSYEKKVTATRLKKFYSTMLNVIKLSENDNGEMSTWDFPKQAYDTSINKFFEKYYLPYMSGYDECYSGSCFTSLNYSLTTLSGANAIGMTVVRYIVKTSDGMYLYFLPNTPGGYIWMFVDTNGPKNPNKIGRDIFVFDIFAHPDPLISTNFRLKFWHSYLSEDYDFYSTNNFGCNKKAAGYAGFDCGEVIFRNNWEIPDDYPW